MRLVWNFSVTYSNNRYWQVPGPVTDRQRRQPQLCDPRNKRKGKKERSITNKREREAGRRQAETKTATSLTAIFTRPHFWGKHILFCVDKIKEKRKEKSSVLLSNVKTQYCRCWLAQKWEQLCRSTD